jgi:uncharacterized protein YmfQ (DUF2313 family)
VTVPEAWYTLDYGGGGGPVVTTQAPDNTPTIVSTMPVTIASASAAAAFAAPVFIAAISVPPPTPTFALTRLPVPVVTVTPRYSASDYAGAAFALLPRGRVWRAEPGGVQAGVLAALGAGLARVDAAGSVLLALPGQPTPLLPEWEATLGLPDPCAGSAPTIAQRASQVGARLATAGSQSRDFYISFAAALGFQITIETFAPFRAGHSRAGSRVSGAGWQFVWAVHILNDTGLTGAFRVGAARAGDPLSTASYARAVLECEFNRLKSAETVLLFPS